MDTTSIRRRIPGIALCAALAIPCWFLGRAVPIVGGPVFGILLGMAIALRWKDRDSFQEGIRFTSKKILQYAVVLLGFGLNLGQIAQVGAQSLPVIIATVSTSLIVAFALCKTMRIPGKVATLIGVGSSICGGSAIAATAPVIKAEDEDVATAISVVFLFNVVAALTFPALGTAIGLSDAGFGLFAGTAVNDTSSVTAAAASWDGMHPGANTLDDATVVKLTRTLAIIPITFVLAIWTARRESGDARTEKNLGGFSLKRAFPMFILWFLVASVITTTASLAGFDPAIFAPLKEASKYFIIMAMLAIGLNTDLIKLVRSGAKPIGLGLCCWVAIALVSLAVQHAIGIW